MCRLHSLRQLTETRLTDIRTPETRMQTKVAVDFKVDKNIQPRKIQILFSFMKTVAYINIVGL